MPYHRSAEALTRLRSCIFEYDNTPKQAKAERVLGYLKARKLRGRPQAPVGPCSGLTRRELAASGTCETDWY